MSSLSVANWFLGVILPHERADIKTLKVVDDALTFWEAELEKDNIKPNLIQKHFWLDEYEWSEELERFCLQHNIGIY